MLVAAILAEMEKQFSDTTLRSWPTFRPNAPVIIRVKVKNSGKMSTFYCCILLGIHVIGCHWRSKVCEDCPSLPVSSSLLSTNPGSPVLCPSQCVEMHLCTCPVPMSVTVIPFPSLQGWATTSGVLCHIRVVLSVVGRPAQWGQDTWVNSQIWYTISPAAADRFTLERPKGYWRLDLGNTITQHIFFQWQP